MGKGGQYQRLLLAVVILGGEIGAFLLLGALALGVILAQILLLLLLAFAPVALVVAVFPGRGHDFFRAWLTKLAGYLARKVVYSLILAVILAVCQALDDATSNLGWLLRSLRAQPTRASPGMRARRPHVVALRSTHARPGPLLVSAVINDGGLVDYSIGLLLVAHGGRLLVSGLEGGA